MEYKYYLSVCVCIKNEGIYINEFIQHYMNQGVDHFYIINNNSDDNINEMVSTRINKETFESTLNNMILYKASISLVRNIVHYGNISCCQSTLFETANKFKYQLEENILVLPIYTISFLNLQKYIDNFNGVNTFNNFYDILIMNNYFGNKLTSENKYKDKLMVIIKNLEETNIEHSLYQEVFTPKVNEGDFIIFPSHLDHVIYKNNSDDFRVTTALNFKIL